MTLVEHFRAMARNNAWSNHCLLQACAALSPAEFAAERVSFFPSIPLTLNHILTVDWYYLDALEAGGKGRSVFEPEVPFPDLPELAVAQAASDRRLVAFCDGLSEPRLADPVRLDRGPRGVKQDTVAAVLAHLFVHQIHHRGQVHAMLAGTPVEPPQLDEFFLAEDQPMRAEELRGLGFEAETLA